MSEPKEVTIHDVLDFINDPDLDPTYRTRIVEALNYNLKRKRRAAKAQFHVGQRITWYSNSQYRQVVGRITKINRVNLDVCEEGSGTRWRCSPQLCKPA